MIVSSQASAPNALVTSSNLAHPLRGIPSMMRAFIRLKPNSRSAVETWMSVSYRTRARLKNFDRGGGSSLTVIGLTIAGMTAIIVLSSDAGPLPGTIFVFPLLTALGYLVNRLAIGPVERLAKAPGRWPPDMMSNQAERVRLLEPHLTGVFVERTLERVRLELGETDCQALTLLLTFPEADDAPRGGEAEELLSRVEGLFEEYKP